MNRKSWRERWKRHIRRTVIIPEFKLSLPRLFRRPRRRPQHNPLPNDIAVDLGDLPP